MFCEINDNTPGFCLVLSEAYSQPCKTNNMKCFEKIVNVQHSQLFLQKAPSQMFLCILNTSLIIVSEYFSAYVSVFSIITSTLNQQSSEAVFHRCPLKQVFEKFRNVHMKHLCRSLFLITLQACKSAILLKRDSNTGVFL